LGTPKKTGRPPGTALPVAKKRGKPNSKFWSTRGFLESPSPTKQKTKPLSKQTQTSKKQTSQQSKKPISVRRNSKKPTPRKARSTSRDSSSESETETKETAKPSPPSGKIVGKQVKVEFKDPKKPGQIIRYAGQITKYNEDKNTYSVYFFKDDSTVHGLTLEEFIFTY